MVSGRTSLTCKELCKRVARSKPPHSACSPEVTHLTVEAIHDFIDSMPDLAQALPNLIQLTVTTRGPLCKQHTLYESDVEHCVQCCCWAIRHCKAVRVLQLDLSEGYEWGLCEVVLEDFNRHLDVLPPSLDEIRSDARMEGLQKATGFMSRVRVLNLNVEESSFPCNDLPELLRMAPLLQEFTVTRGQFHMEMMWSEDARISVAEVCDIKRRLLGGFKLGCEDVTFGGAIEQLWADIELSLS
ncbi:MAG: hypothetical protein WDW38_010635 [Sanguina aurantia]